MIDLYCCNKCRRVVGYRKDEVPDTCGAASTARSTSGMLGEYTVRCPGLLHRVDSPDPFVPYQEPPSEEEQERQRLSEAFLEHIKQDFFGN